MIIRVNEWVTELKLLTKIAKFYPQAAYCAFRSAFRQKFDFIIRTIPNISHLLPPIENVIRQEFITSLFEGRTCNDEECQLLSLQIKLCGMGITNITSISEIEYEIYKKATKNLVDKIKNKKKNGSSANLENSSNQQQKFKSSTEFYDNLLKTVKSKMTPARKPTI